MSSSVDLLSAVDDFPLALGASLFLADGRVSRVIFIGIGVSKTAAWVTFVASRQHYVVVLLPFHHFQFRP